MRERQRERRLGEGMWGNVVDNDGGDHSDDEEEDNEGAIRHDVEKVSLTLKLRLPSCIASYARLVSTLQTPKEG